MFNDATAFIKIITNGNFNKILTLSEISKRELGQSRQTLLYENVYEMNFRISEEKSNYIWLANPTLFFHLHALSTTWGNKLIDPVSKSFDEESKIHINYILEKPILWCKFLPPVGNLGDLILFSPEKFFKNEKCAVLLGADN